MGSHGFDCCSSALSRVEGWKNTGYGLPGTQHKILLKHLGDVSTILLDLVCFSLFPFHVIPDRLDDDQIRSVWRSGCCLTPCANKNLIGLLK